MPDVFTIKPQDRIALDRSSARSYDDDGHLHVKRTPISKAVVNEYLGSEIPKADELGLDPKKRYKLLRDPEELARGADTFHNKPLLLDHNPVTADAHDHDRTVGNVSNPEFEHPYLYADLSCWSGPAIRTVEDRTIAEISSAYRYDADMTPGEFEGQAYDGVMRNIRCNHVSLVKKGRAGPDVVVADSALYEGTLIMKKTSLAAAFAQGVVSQYILGKVAQDAKPIDIAPLFNGVNKGNFSQRKPLIVLGLKGALHGKIAKDADLEDVDAMVDRVEDAVEDLVEAVNGGGSEGEGYEPAATDDASNAEVVSFLEGKLSAEDMAKVREMLGDAATPSPVPAQDGGAPKPGIPAQDSARAPAPAKPIDTSKFVTRPAMDAELERVRTEERDRARAVREAEAFCHPFSGNLPAMDSAEDVYRATCDVLAIPHKGVHASALKPLIEMKTSTAAAPAPKKAVAMDTAQNAELKALFPNMDRI